MEMPSPLLLDTPVSKLPARVWGARRRGEAEERIRVWVGGDVPAVFDRSQG